MYLHISNLGLSIMIRYNRMEETPLQSVDRTLKSRTTFAINLTDTNCKQIIHTFIYKRSRKQRVRVRQRVKCN